MLGGALVAETDRGSGRYEADAAGANDVRCAVDDELGLVLVEVQLPELRKTEDVGAARDAVHADADVRHLRRLTEVELRFAHGEKLPAPGPVGAARR